MIYILTFVFSVGLLFCVERRHPWSVERGLAVTVALLAPCLLAAFRASSIGTDVMVYARPLFDLAVGSPSLQSFLDSSWVGGWTVRKVSDIEIGFLAVTYLGAKATRSFAFVLFIIQALTIVPIYCAIRKMGRGVSTWLGMAVYLFLYFNSSLNVMRQWIAMGFILLAFAFLFNGSRRPFLLFIIFGELFHYSAVLMLGVALVYWYLEGGQAEGKSNTIRFVIVCALVIGVLPGLQLVASLLSVFGFGQYVAGYLSGAVSIMPNQILLRLPVLLLLFSRSNNQMQPGIPSGRFFAALAVFDVVASQLGSVGEQSTRIALYFGLFQIFSLPLAARSQTTRLRKGLVTLSILIYLMLYWFAYYVVFGWHATFPYVFAGL